MVLAWDVAVNKVRKADEEQTNGSTRHPAVTALVVVLVLEAAALVAAAVYFVVELLVATPSSLASAVGITVIIAAGAVWVAFIAVGVLRAQAWTRAAVIVVQVLIGAIAIGSFQGPTPRPDLGVILLVPAVIAMVLLFQKPVLAATTGRDDTGRTY
jgi:hypothetical protein